MRGRFIVPASESIFEGSHLNLTELNQDLDQSPEEAKADSAQEGKPQCINPIIFVYIYLIYVVIYLSAHLRF